MDERGSSSRQWSSGLCGQQEDVSACKSHANARIDKKIPKEGEIELEWFTNEGGAQTSKLKIGNVSKTLISADRLLECGNEVYLSRKNPRVIKGNGETIPLKRKNGMFILEMWYKVPDDKMFFPRPGR